MPSETSRKESTKLFALIAVFLLVVLVAILFYTLTLKKDNSNKATNNQSSSTETSNEGWQIFTSQKHGFSISYPNSWTKTTGATTGQASNAEIILLNLTDRETRDNGKPNMIVYAGATIDFCNSGDIPICNETNLIVNGIEVKKYNDLETGDIFYDMGNGVLIFTTANGDQATIDKVINTYKRS